MGPGYYLLGNEEKENLCNLIDIKRVSRYQEKSYVSEFEDKCKKYFDIKYSLGMNSCTSALICGLKAAGIQKGDEVIVPAFTFVATVAAIVIAGAKPIFANIDESFNIDCDDIEKRITKKTKAVLCVHMLGNSCEMDKLRFICMKNNLKLFEDVAQSFGGAYKGKKLGTYGEFGAFSLNIYKVITAGDGGVLITDNEELYNKAFSYHDHGFQSPLKRVIDSDNGIFGYNFRMHEINGALATAQIDKCERILEKLRKNKLLLKERLGNLYNVRYRKLNDIEGDCATVIGMILPSEKYADDYCKIMNTQTLYESQKHCYYSMIPILKRSFDDYSFDSKEYQKTDSILKTAVLISNGMQDNYIGSSFGLNILSKDEDIDIVAGKICEVFKRL